MWSKLYSILIKLYINVGCYFTVCRVKKIAEISLVLSENEDFDGALSFRVKWKVNPAQDLRGCIA